MLIIHRDEDDWVVRDLARPDKPRVESWEVDRLSGFGLMQSERDFNKYRDDEARYHLRPNVWVETGDSPLWTNGRVELLELDAKHEGVDNIGAYYVVNAEQHPTEEPIDFDYTLTFTTKLPAGFTPELSATAGND